MGAIRFKTIVCKTTNPFEELKNRFLTEEFLEAHIYLIRMVSGGVWHTVLGHKNTNTRANLLSMNYFGEFKYFFYNNSGWADRNISTNNIDDFREIVHKQQTLCNNSVELMRTALKRGIYEIDVSQYINNNGYRSRISLLLCINGLVIGQSVYSCSENDFLKTLQIHKYIKIDTDSILTVHLSSTSTNTVLTNDDVTISRTYILQR